MSDDRAMHTAGEGRRRVLGRLVGGGIVLMALLLAGLVLRRNYIYPRTDDAAVRANVVGIAPRVGGPIVELPIVDNQYVAQGDLLFVVDPRPYQAVLDERTAQLELVEFELQAFRQAIAAAEAEIMRREAGAAYARDYLSRLEPLLKREFVTADQVADARSKQRAADASVARAREERDRQQALLAGDQQVNARLKVARARVEDAQLNVGYCTVRAPVPGWVTNLNLSVGAYANQGIPVFALVDDRQWWVLAYFRENYLEHIRPGMKAEVYLLSYPDRPFRGIVEGVGRAIWEPEDASRGGIQAVKPTLDWVRLAQRFPVRITLLERDPDRPFRMGATVVATIRGADD